MTIQSHRKPARNCARGMMLGRGRRATSLEPPEAGRQPTVQVKQRMGCPSAVPALPGPSPRPSRGLMSSSPTTIITGIDLRHRRVRRGRDWASCHHQRAVSSLAILGRRLGVMPNKQSHQASLAEQCSKYIPSQRATKRASLWVALSAAWRPESNEGQRYLRRGRGGLPKLKYIACLLTHCHKHLYRLNHCTEVYDSAKSQIPSHSDLF
jgi:hypothetical protein